MLGFIIFNNLTIREKSSHSYISSTIYTFITIIMTIIRVALLWTKIKFCFMLKQQRGNIHIKRETRLQFIVVFITYIG